MPTIFSGAAKGLHFEMISFGGGGTSQISYLTGIAWIDTYDNTSGIVLGESKKYNSANVAVSVKNGNIVLTFTGENNGNLTYRVW